MSEPVSAMHKAAREYAARGMKVFPCAPGTKRPWTDHGFHDATTDLEQIDRWWAAEPELNPAMCPHEVGLAVVDLDGADGEAAWLDRQIEHGEAPETYTVETPRGGRHLYFRGVLPASQSILGPHVDTRGVGSYALLPPSVVDGKPYIVQDDREPAELPEWVGELIERRRAPRMKAAPGIELDLPGNVSRARKLLTDYAKRGKVAVSGQNGNKVTYVTACEVMGLGVSPETSLELIEEHWNPHCVPPWDHDELETIVANAASYAQNEPGCYAVRSGEAVFRDALDKLGLTGESTARLNASIGYPQPKSAAELASGTFPRASFAWDRFVLQRHVNLLYGDGGTGKTLLALHVAVAVAAGLPLFGLETVQMPVLIVLAEDDDGETKARLEAICGMVGVNLADLPLTVWCLPGWDAGVARVREDGTWEPGPFMEPLRAELARIGPCLLVLDTVSDIAALDETKRLPVNTLCKVVLGGLCREFGATVLVNAHPSKAAMADGSDYAGSTAWNNAVRNRLTFKRPEPRSPRRVLEVAKANYGGEGALELYQVGLTFLPLAEAGHSDTDERDAVLSVVLDMLDRGISVVKTHGSGQKPRDVAKEVREKHGLNIDPGRVLDHLSALERQGRLTYTPGGHTKRGQRAGFARPEVRQ